MAFNIKQNDRRPLFVVGLKDDFGESTESAVDLTTATGAVFNMRLASSPFTVKVNRGSAAITNAAAGEVTYTWGTADTTLNGTFDAEVEIAWADGKVETFPGAGYFEVIVWDDIA